MLINDVIIKLKLRKVIKSPTCILHILLTFLRWGTFNVPSFTIYTCYKNLFKDGADSY